MQEIVLDGALNRDTLKEQVTRAEAALWLRFMTLNNEALVVIYKLWAGALGRAAQSLNTQMSIELIQDQLNKDWAECKRREARYTQAPVKRLPNGK